MLDKQVCRQCRVGVNEALAPYWTECDETRWKEGIVWCLALLNTYREVVYTSNPPPPECPYALEHGVAQGLERAE